MRAIRAFGSLYRLLLRLYPRHFRDEFAGEMWAVFENALAEATKEYPLATCMVFWRELRDLPRAVVIAHLQERRRVMGNQTESIPERPMPWWTMLAAVSLFTLPALTASGTVFPRPVGPFLFLGIPVFAILAFVVDAIKTKRFPRWFLPYAGLLLIVLVSSGLRGTSPMVHLYRQVIKVGDELSRYTWQAIRSGLLWFFLLAVLGVVVLACATLPPLRPMFTRIRHDWTSLSFLLYGAVVFVYLIDFDEYQYEGGYVLAGTVSLALGAWLHLRGKTTRRRILALLSGMTLAMWIMAVGKWIIVPRQDWSVWFSWHPPKTERWFESVCEVITWAWMMIAIPAPALLGLLPRAKEPASG